MSIQYHIRGWTLIELVLTLSLIGIVSMVVFRVSYDSQTFSHYQFSQQLLSSIQQMKLAQLYSQEPSSLEIVDQSVVLTLGSDGHPKVQWHLMIPKGINTPNLLGPVPFNHDSAIDTSTLQFETKHHIIKIEPRTGYAYQSPPKH